MNYFEFFIYIWLFSAFGNLYIGFLLKSFIQMLLSLSLILALSLVIRQNKELENFESNSIKRDKQ